MSYRALLLDIEGTTTSIAFVYDTLFPYARRALGPFLQARFDAPAVREAVALLGAEAPRSPEAATAAALALMDSDAKHTGLKALQGMVWEAGYASGELRGHVFADVPTGLRALHDRGVPVFIYSSGSVAAQRLLFGHSEAGDLTPLLSGYFDTTTGPKRVAASYLAIARTLEQAPGDVLFVTDNLDEARAAEAAGLQVAVSVRPGNPPLPAHPFREITSLGALA